MKNSPFCKSIALAAVLLLGSAPLAQAQTAAPPGRVALVVSLKAKPGKEAELETAFIGFVAKVHQSGLAQVFQLARGATPGSYKLIEIFKDPTALAAHRETPHVKAFGATFGALLDGPNQAEQLTVVE